MKIIKDTRPHEEEGSGPSLRIEVSRKCREHNGPLCEECGRCPVCKDNPVYILHFALNRIWRERGCSTCD